MGVAINRTKLIVPRRRPDLLSRPRLNVVLADILDYPFTLISAPPGYGKTSLLIDLAHQASHPVCWFTIDPLDKNPKRFLAHFLNTIKSEFPHCGKQSDDLLDDLTDPLKSPEHFTGTLVNDIYCSVTENFAIFLDDFHLLDNHPQILNFISLFGQQMDDNAHLVISSRTKFNIPDLPLLIGRKMVKGIDQEDLAFEPMELIKYIQEKYGAILSEDQSTEIISRTGGWITGILMTKDEANNHFPEQTKAAIVSGTNLDDYFADQICRDQPESICNLMLQTSLFDEFNEGFLRDVLGESKDINYSTFIETLTKHNLFVEQLNDIGIWVRYHHLFRDYLQRELEKKFPGKKEQILSKIINLHSKSKDWELAYSAACMLGNSYEMANVIHSASSSLFHSGRIILLADWLDTLPEEGYIAFPSLISLRGFAHIETGNPIQGLNVLNKAIEDEKIISNPVLLSQSIVWRSTANRLLGNYEIGINDSLQLIDNLRGEIKTHQVKAEAYREIGLGYGRLGSSSKALAYLKKAFDEYKKIQKPDNIAQVRMDIGLELMNSGNYQEAESIFLDLIPHWSEHGNNIQLSIIMNNLGYLSSLLGKFVSADNWIRKGEEYAKLVSSKRMLAFNTASRGDLSLSLNQFSKGINYYKKALQISDEIHDSFLSIYIRVALASCYRCLNNLTRAKELLEEIREAVVLSDSKYEQGLWYLEWGFLHLIMNKLQISLESFQVSHSIFSQTNRQHEITKTLLGLCLCAKKNELYSLLDEHLFQLNTILKSNDALHSIVPEISRHMKIAELFTANNSMHTNLEKCLEEANQYLHRLPEVREAVFPEFPQDSDSNKLIINAFGEINVLLDEKPLTSSEWIHQRTVREFFFFLLSHPRGLTKEQVGIAFWPDSSNNQLSSQFKNAIYRLRRAIGKEKIQFHQETRKYSFDWECDYEFDVEKFLNALNSADHESQMIHRIEHLKRATSIYKHPFAPQLEGTWAIPLRRKYYLLFEKAQLEIASYNLLINNFSACKDICLAILDIEPCQEKAFQLCMKAYSGLKNITEVRRTFFWCKENFGTHLGIRPSNMTVNLYKDLISK